MKNFYITTPIYYVNAKPHLGGAYTTLAADVLARWHRMKGEKVYFLTGTDEHGQKITQEAAKQEISPQQLCDQNVAKYKQVWDSLKISYNKFIRTTEPDHEGLVKKIFQELKNKNLIYQGTYQGFYCVGCERYYTNKELKNGQCPIHQKKVVTLSEKCYFFKLSAFQEILIKLIKSKKWVIEPKERKNEVLGFLNNEKLEDLAVSREKVAWGVNVPWDKDQTIYVWIDALLNYLSGVKWQGDSKKLPKLWPPEIQLIGKDILRFHAILWPALLLSLNIPLPKKLYAHGFFTVGRKKMSKSLGNVLDPEELATIFGADALRWLMFSAYPFGQDGDISLSRFYDRYNADLANGLGNLTRRVLTLAAKSKPGFKFQKRDLEFEKVTKRVWKNYEKFLKELKFEKVLTSINNLIKFCDKYIEVKEPWRLFENNFASYQKVLYNLLESLRHLAWLTQPFMPGKSDQIFKRLGLLKKEKKRALSQGKQWGKTNFNNLTSEEVLFPRL